MNGPCNEEGDKWTQNHLATEADNDSFWMDENISEVSIGQRQTHPQGDNGEGNREKIFSEEGMHAMKLEQIISTD